MPRVIKPISNRRSAAGLGSHLAGGWKARPGLFSRVRLISKAPDGIVATDRHRAIRGRLAPASVDDVRRTRRVTEAELWPGWRRRTRAARDTRFRTGLRDQTDRISQRHAVRSRFDGTMLARSFRYSDGRRRMCAGSWDRPGSFEMHSRLRLRARRGALAVQVNVSAGCGSGCKAA